MPAKQRKSSNLFSYIHSLSSFKLFLIAFLLSIVLTGSFFYYLSHHPSLIVKPITGDFIIDLTLFGRFFMLSGIIPGFLILIIIFRYLDGKILKIYSLYWTVSDHEFGLQIYSNKYFELFWRLFSELKKAKVCTRLPT